MFPLIIGQIFFKCCIHLCFSYQSIKFIGQRGRNWEVLPTPLWHVLVFWIVKTLWWYRERRRLQVFLIYVYNHKGFQISLFFWFLKNELLVKVALKTCTPKEYTRINNFSDSTTISIWFWLNEMGLYWVKCTFVRKKCINVKETYVFIYFFYVTLFVFLCLGTVVIHLRTSWNNWLREPARITAWHGGK